jgi:hypothetical protein
MGIYVSIVNGDAVTFPCVGDRVQIRPVLKLVALAGMQFKGEVSAPLEGVVEALALLAPRSRRRFTSGSARMTVPSAKPPWHSTTWAASTGRTPPTPNPANPPPTPNRPRNSLREG